MNVCGERVYQIVVPVLVAGRVVGVELERFLLLHEVGREHRRIGVDVAHAPQQIPRHMRTGWLHVRVAIVADGIIELGVIVDVVPEIFVVRVVEDFRVRPHVGGQHHFIESPRDDRLASVCAPLHGDLTRGLIRPHRADFRIVDHLRRGIRLRDREHCLDPRLRAVRKSLPACAGFGKTAERGGEAPRLRQWQGGEDRKQVNEESVVEQGVPVSVDDAHVRRKDVVDEIRFVEEGDGRVGVEKVVQRFH